MGAWGYGLLENDGILDFQDSVMEEKQVPVPYIVREINSAAKDKDPHSLAGILLVLQQRMKKPMAATEEKALRANYLHGLRLLEKLHKVPGIYAKAWGEEGASYARKAVSSNLRKIKTRPGPAKSARKEARVPAKKTSVNRVRARDLATAFAEVDRGRSLGLSAAQLRKKVHSFLKKYATGSYYGGTPTAAKVEAVYKIVREDLATLKRQLSGEKKTRRSRKASATKKGRRSGTLRLHMDQKFYNLTLRGSTVTAHWGRDGTAGQKKTWRFSQGPEFAQDFMEHKIAQKLAKGYVEVRSQAPARKPRKARKSSTSSSELTRLTTKALVAKVKRGSAAAKKELARRGRGPDGKKRS